MFNLIPFILNEQLAEIKREIDGNGATHTCEALAVVIRMILSYNSALLESNCLLKAFQMRLHEKEIICFQPNLVLDQIASFLQ